MIQWSHYSLDKKRDRLNIEDCILNTGIAMKRIGVAASKMAKGNLVLYNFYVVLISFLFSLFILIVAGSSVVLAIIILAYVANEIMGVELEKSWSSILSVCMVSLTVIIAVFNLFAISQNIKLPKNQD